MFRRVGLFAALVVVACCSKSDVPSTGAVAAPDPGPAPGPSKPTFTVFALAEVRGQIGPCGCTTDPLGDISRTARLIEQARAAGPVLVVDAGSLLYSKAPIPGELLAQETFKANLLAETYQGALKVDAIGLGPADLPAGLDQLRLPRLASNASELPGTAPKLIEIGGAKAGVFGVIGEGAVAGVKLGDPVTAGKQAIAQLRSQGAQVVIGLIQAQNKRDAAKLVREIGGIDLAIAGLGLQAPDPEAVDPTPQRIGESWMVVPVNRGQVVARLDVTLRGPGPLSDAIGPGAATAHIERLDKQLASLDKDLAAFATDKTADPAFVAQKRQERTRLAAERTQLSQHPLVAPARGSYFTLTQIRINKALACDVQVQDAVSRYYHATGEANVKAAARIAVAAPAPGKASYIGNKPCADCHAEAASFWAESVHATAWKTLEDRGQQFDLDCIGCHVTGWQRPGGSNLGHNDKLRDVQCEACHGPGSIHVAKRGLEKPFAIQLDPPKELCMTCHTKEHSDTFDFVPYLRDIVGSGHGETRRDKLGDGPTGAQLRKAGLDKAGRTVGAGCTR